MKRRNMLLVVLAMLSLAALAGIGKLRVSDNQRFLQYESGEPFFWLGETAWLMPERLNRDEVAYYLQCCHEAEYNLSLIHI